MDEREIQQLATRIACILRPSKLYMDLQAAAQDEAVKGNFRISEIKKGLLQNIQDTEFDRSLRNFVFSYLKSNDYLQQQDSEQNPKEPISYLLKAQQNWEKRILKSLNNMCTELNMPLARKRPEKNTVELMSQWTELGTHEREPTNIRPVYAPKDFLEVIVSIHNQSSANRNMSGQLAMWGIIQTALKVKDLQQLRSFYSELSMNHCQIGIDDTIDSLHDFFFADHIRFGKKVIAERLAPVSQEYSKRGCPISLRATLWCQMLGINLDNMDYLYYEQLKNYVLKHELLTDKLFLKDIKLTATNDDQYFIFEDFLYQILLPFSRDTTLLQCLNQAGGRPLKSYIRGKLGNEDYAVAFPPSGVIPFHGFSMYVVPLCYLYSEPVKLYYVFRKMYTRFFFRLHIISSHEEGIVSLCLLFENLLQSLEPELFFHLKRHGIQPLRIAFKWLIRAFSGFLASDQVLLLWDRILAFNSLQILSILAAAVFSFRKSNLLKVQNFAAAESVFADLMTLQVIPLIQLVLFSK